MQFNVVKHWLMQQIDQCGAEDHADDQLTQHTRLMEAPGNRPADARRDDDQPNRQKQFHRRIMFHRASFAAKKSS